uniref:Uncharacterized protein n=1 Tax=Pyxicephalus adspersus TaxID=30357 RepID=A0AAV3AGR6_PYXAD|nr:TPA: hypothetical protein GDO54_017854 [Pyxicephalus adspersus]
MRPLMMVMCEVRAVITEMHRTQTHKDKWPMAEQILFICVDIKYEKSMNQFGLQLSTALPVFPEIFFVGVLYNAGSENLKTSICPETLSFTRRTPEVS